MSYSYDNDDNITGIADGLDDRVATARTPSDGGNADIRRFVTAPDGRAIGEYGSSASDVRAEFIWLSPEVGDSGMFGGDDGLGGYMPIAVATAAPGGGTTLTYVHADHLGTPIVITDATGIAIAPPGGYTTPAFPGQSRTLADLYYNRYRDYDPTTGRYIQADPTGLAGGQSPYSYAMGNPLRYYDPWGLKEYNLFPYFEPDKRAGADKHYDDMPNSEQDRANHIYGHGNPSVFCVYGKDGKQCLNPQQFVNWLTDNHVNINKPIILWGCKTARGDKSFAEQLSQLLGGTKVTGATGNTRWNWDGYQGLEAGERWRTFGGQ